MHILTKFSLFVLLSCVLPLSAEPLLIDSTFVTPAGDVGRFRLQIPSNYSPDHPPAILIGWHALGGSEVEIFAFPYDELCEQRGWIIASHMGPNDRHWNTRLPQLHCRTMLEWIEERYPFSRDSIYMCGGSMGAAAGQVWHNNNCAYDDYLIAATAGGSMILDTQLRQEQYLASGDTNRSMRVAFGGLPSLNDSVAYEYHRYSAVHFADTNESMHFNALTLPIWSNWGAEQFEWDAYGYAAQNLSVLREGHAESRFFPAAWNGHGFSILVAEDVCTWFAQYAANRFPDTLSIAADEDGRYYYCDIELADSAFTFGRADVRKDSASKRLDIVLLHNVAELRVNFAFPWPELDTLYCHWEQTDVVPRASIIRLAGLPNGLQVRQNDSPWQDVEIGGTYSKTIAANEEFVLYFDVPVGIDPPPLPTSLAIVNAYPNPFNGVLRLTIASPDSRGSDIKVFDPLGRVVASRFVTLVPGDNNIALELPELSSGAYWVRANQSEPVRVVLLR